MKKIILATIIVASAASANSEESKQDKVNSTFFDKKISSAKEFQAEKTKKLKKYYASATDYNECNKKTSEMLAISENQNVSKELRTSSAKQKQEMILLCRKLFASHYEYTMRENNIGADVFVSGSKSEKLNIKYILMSDQMVFILRNKAGIDETAAKAGFKKVIYTDGNTYWTTELE